MVERWFYWLEGPGYRQSGDVPATVNPNAPNREDDRELVHRLLGGGAPCRPPRKKTVIVGYVPATSCWTISDGGISVRPRKRSGAGRVCPRPADPAAPDLLGIIDAGRLIYTYNTVSNSARERSSRGDREPVHCGHRQHATRLGDRLVDGLRDPVRRRAGDRARRTSRSRIATRPTQWRARTHRRSAAWPSSRSQVVSSP